MPYRSHLRWKTIASPDSGLESAREPGDDREVAASLPLSPRDETIFLLHIAAEIEHGLLVEYLYAAYSLETDPAVLGERAAQTAAWQREILGIALEEMGHLISIQNVLRLIGGALLFEREDYPFRSDLYPFHFSLEPLSKATVAKYVVAEMPPNPALTGLSTEARAEILRRARIAAGQAVNEVGKVYEKLLRLLTSLSKDEFLTGTEALQASPREFGVSESVVVFNEHGRLKSVGTGMLIVVATPENVTGIIQAIAQQGEGLSDSVAAAGTVAHFRRFLKIYEQFPEPGDWRPARTVAPNPNTSQAADRDDPSEAALASGRIDHPESALVAQFANVRYRWMLATLTHLLQTDASHEPARRSRLVAWAMEEMTALRNLAGVLMRMPQHAAVERPERAGPPFELPFMLALPESELGKWRQYQDLVTTTETLAAQLRGSALAGVVVRAIASSDEENRLPFIQAQIQRERAIQDPPTRPTPAFPAFDPRHSGKRVVIVGGGLAGLSAAAELVTRGFQVILIEKAERVGGKLTAWRDKDGSTIEHGMHGWWRQYFNYFDLMRRAGVNDVLLDAPPAAAVFHDGTRWVQKPSTFVLPTPFFLLQRILSLGRFNLWDMLSGAKAFTKMFAFDPQRDMAQYDSEPMYTFMRREGATQRLHDLAISPFARSFAFDSTERLSASAVIGGLNFYFIGHQDDVKTRWCRGNPQELVLEPIAKYIRDNGGTIVTSQAVSGFATDENTRRVTAVNLGTGGAANELGRVPLASIPANQPLLTTLIDGTAVIVRRNAGAFIVFRNFCSHQGGNLVYEPGTNQFRCERHGGRFSLDGVAVQPPPVSALEPLRTRVDGSDLVIGGGGGSSQSLEADFFVLATEVEAAKRIVLNNPAMLKHEPLRRIMNLEATEVIVLRLWLDRRPPEGVTTGVFADLGFLDSFFILSTFQDEFAAYPGTVIELQAYVVKDWIELPDAALLEKSLFELGRYIPEFSGARAVKWNINRHRDLFTFHAVGSYANRPETQSPYENLTLAGDWVRLPDNWWMMEKAVTSGKYAANTILNRCQMPEAEIFHPDPPELFTKMLRFVKRVWTGLVGGLRAFVGFKKLATLLREDPDL